MWITVAMLLFVSVSTAAGKIIYVDADADAAGGDNGSSWQDAYKCLQDALTAAKYGDEIRAAEGVYKPDEHVVTGRFGPQVSGSGDRN